MLRHQELEHGANTKPDFVMRVVRFYKTALSRQIGEAIRIQKRGGEGAILNSKAEFNRCQIPRLVVEEVDTEEQKKLEEQEVERLQELIERNREEWGSKKHASASVCHCPAARLGTCAGRCLRSRSLPGMAAPPSFWGD